MSPTTQLARVTSLQSVRCVEEVTCSLQPLCSRCLGCAWSGLPTNCTYTSHVLEMWEVKKKMCKKCCKLFWDTTRLKFKRSRVFCMLQWERIATWLWFILSLWSCSVPVRQTFSLAARHPIQISVRSCKMIITSSDQLRNIIHLPLSYSEVCVTFTWVTL